jgi:hypothetical protein
MSSQTYWTDKLLNELFNVSDQANGTVYATNIKSYDQDIVNASFGYQVNDYYTELKYWAYYDLDSKLLHQVERVGVAINHLMQLGPWQPLLRQTPTSEVDGNMNVTAGSGAQRLIGGPGDTLNGGHSADTFVFVSNFGKETINDFHTTRDVIELPHSLFANFAAVQADMHSSGANTVIALDAHDAITLSHVEAHNLHAQNFHFIV